MVVFREIENPLRQFEPTFIETFDGLGKGGFKLQVYVGGRQRCGSGVGHRSTPIGKCSPNTTTSASEGVSNAPQGVVDAKPSAAANAWSGGAPRRGRGEARAPTQPELFGIGSEVLQCEFWALAHKGDGVLIDDFVDVGFCIPAAAHLESCLRNR